MDGRKIGALIRLLRPKNAVMASIGVMVGWFNSGGIPSVDLLLACLVPPLVLMGGNAINDYFDYPIDAINKPERPIPSGEVSLKEALASYLVLSSVGVAISSLLGPKELIIAAFFAIAWYLYASRLKGMGLPGNVLVSLGVAFTLIYGAVASGNITPKVLTFASIAFLSNMAREITKTIEDVEGDSKYGLRTVAAAIGLRKAGLLAAAFAIAAIIPTFIPLWIFEVGIPYLIMSVIFPTPLLLLAGFKVVKNPTVDEAAKVSSLLKLAMFLGMMGMLFDPICRRASL